jgi:hypothetical protein
MGLVLYGLYGVEGYMCATLCVNIRVLDFQAISYCSIDTYVCRRRVYDLRQPSRQSATEAHNATITAMEMLAEMIASERPKNVPVEQAYQSPPDGHQMDSFLAIWNYGL